MNFSIKSLFAIWSFSSQRFQYYFNLSNFLGSMRNIEEILNLSEPSVCHAVGLLILLKLCPVFTFLQQLMTKGL